MDDDSVCNNEWVIIGIIIPAIYLLSWWYDKPYDIMDIALELD